MNVKIEASWKDVLKEEFEKPYFDELSRKIRMYYSENRAKVFPKGSEIFSAFDLCPFKTVKVVILGQDPYPTRGHAHGLSFSVKDEVRPFPKSLNNIFKEISDDLNQDLPSNGNLTRWAEQGILLLNSVLTVEEGKPDSHKGIGWEQFTDIVIEKISTHKSQVVFILWGSKAVSKEFLIDSSKHLILKSVHPSPLSAYRGFFGCRHFSKTNSFLKRNDRPIIHW
jgi:uracil-DNA glycosylase